MHAPSCSATLAAPVLLLTLGVSALPLRAELARPPTPGVSSPQTALRVLHDSGRGVPLATYIAQLVGAAEENTVLPQTVFPYHTALAPGVLTREGMPVLDAAWLTQPMVIVSADDRSMRWLAFNRERLQQLHAVALVVQAQNAQAFKALQQLADLPIAPETSPWLAQRLIKAHAGVYPLLIHTDGRAYQIPGGMKQ